jgi:pantetheine-phosphate adenylyltransferase
VSRPVIAIYPGTFDPITLGHEDIVQRALRLFDRVVIGVAAAYHKKTLFTLDERIALARQSFCDAPQAAVEPFDGLVRDFARAQQAQVMVRGVRSTTDFDYEVQLAGMNRNLMPEVETVFLTPSPAYQFVSSTFVRDIGLLGDEVQHFVAPHVLALLIERKQSGRKP